MEKKSIKSKIIAHLNGELPEEEKKELLDWVCASKENSRFYAEVKDVWDSSQVNFIRNTVTLTEWEGFVNKIKNKERKRRFRFLSGWKEIEKIAAALVVGVLLGVLVPYLTNTKEQGVFYASAPYGAISKVVLPDSSVVILNAGSELKYELASKANSREVELEGEAWFDVTEDNKRPFFVKTAYYQVKVLGTEFVVKAYREDDKIITTLEEGVVQILSHNEFKLNKSINLKAGEQMVYSKKEHQYLIHQVDTERFSSWKDNRLEFIKMNLGDLIKLLERRYDVLIEIQDQSITDFHYSGTLTDESILEVVEILENTLPVRCELNGEKMVIRKLKNIEEGE